MNEKQNSSSLYLSPGTSVRFDGLDKGGPEYGVVVHCWFDHAIGIYDCYVAIFGNAWPHGKPSEIPYILRYASSSLTVISPPAPIGT